MGTWLCAIIVIAGTYILSKQIFESSFKKGIHFEYKRLPLSLKLAVIFFGDIKKFKSKELWMQDEYPTSDILSFKQKLKIMMPFIGFVLICIGTIGAVLFQK